MFDRRPGAIGSLQLLALSVLLYIFAIIIKRRYFSSISDVPGPFLASFSHLWQIQNTISGHTEQETIELHRKHGKFVRIAHNECSVSDPEAIKSVLTAPLRKGDWYQVFSLPDKRFVNQMSELDPKRHIAKFKNISSGYAFSNIIKSEPYIDNAIKILEKQLDKLSKENKPVHFDHWFNYFGFDVLGEVTFSQRFGFLEEGRDIGDAIANTKMFGGYIGIMGHFYWLHDWLLANPLIGWLNLQPSMHIFDTTLAAVERRSKNDEARKDMLEQWKESRAKFPERMEEKEILAAAVVNVGAGADTISATLQAFFYYLLRNQAAFKRLREEIDEAQAKGQLSDPVSHAEAQNLPYLQACIKESLRYHTPVAYGLPRVAPKGGIDVAGRHFTEGTVLSVNPWVIHRSPDLFGPDADTFNPDRWTDPARAREMDKFMIPFGAGYNQCTGRHLAMLEVSKVAATLTRDFDIEQVEPGKAWSFESHFTAIPYGWPCCVKRRGLKG